jgi:hypothetical protein
MLQLLAQTQNNDTSQAARSREGEDIEPELYPSTINDAEDAKEQRRAPDHYAESKRFGFNMATTEGE